MGDWCSACVSQCLSLLSHLLGIPSPVPPRCLGQNKTSQTQPVTVSRHVHVAFVGARVADSCSHTHLHTHTLMLTFTHTLTHTSSHTHTHPHS